MISSMLEAVGPSGASAYGLTVETKEDLVSNADPDQFAEKFNGSDMQAAISDKLKERASASGYDVESLPEWATV